LNPFIEDASLGAGHERVQRAITLVIRYDDQEIWPLRNRRFTQSVPIAPHQKKSEQNHTDADSSKHYLHVANNFSLILDFRFLPDRNPKLFSSVCFSPQSKI
jgi:hypothetical protein